MLLVDLLKAMPMADADFKALSRNDVSVLLSSIPGIDQIVGYAPEKYAVREVGDGNINYVYIVDGDLGGVVVKQAPPVLRVVGDAWPLPPTRIGFEHAALTKQSELVPNLVPRVFHFDAGRALLVMEYLHPHIILRKGLVRGIKFPRFATDIAEFLAQMLFHTSVLALSAERHKALVAQFAHNTALCKITEDLVFTDPYRTAPLNRWNSPHLDAKKQAFENDGPLKCAVQRKKWQFMTEGQALIHGDLHTGSVMVTPTDTRVIDPEFAFMGPMGFDVGAILANIFLSYFSHVGRPHEASEPPFADWVADQAKILWGRFETRFLALWTKAERGGDAFPSDLFRGQSEQETLATYQRQFLQDLLTDSIEFAGAKMIRRVLGLAHVEDLESIEPPEIRAIHENMALSFGRELLLNARSMLTIDEVVRRLAEFGKR
jgi:5-methylthioribose kinase